MATQSQTQRTLLFCFIGSIVCCGLMGIYVLLLGSFGWLEARVLLSTVAAGATSILGMASAVPWERKRWHPLGPVAMLMVACAFVLALTAIWLEPRWQGAEVFWKGFAISCVLAVAFPHVGLLAMARLRRSYEWVRYVTIITIVLLTSQIIATILEVRIMPHELWARLMGVVAIVVVCGTLTTPILHRVSAIRKYEEIRTTTLELSLSCPRCQQTQSLPVGRSACTKCGLKFSIDIEEEHCSKCGYPLFGLQSNVCPECGTPIAV
jgi:hypothetical protein